MPADDANARLVERHERAYERLREAQGRAIAAGARFSESARDFRLSLDAVTAEQDAKRRALRRRLDRFDG